MEKKERLLLALSLAVLGLWLYVVFYKLADHHDFVSSMHRQPLPHWMQWLAIWLLPPVEIALALLFFKKPWRIYGFLFSTALLLVFTLYIAFGLLGFYGKLPCGCGGLIQNLSLKQHLVFNYLCAAIAALGFVLCYEQQGAGKGLQRFFENMRSNKTSLITVQYHYHLPSLYLFTMLYRRKFALFPRGRYRTNTSHSG